MMTKQERTEVEKMSLDVYGNKNMYKKIMQRGKLKDPVGQKTADGGVLNTRRWMPMSLDEVIKDMQDAINSRNKTNGGQDGSQINQEGEERQSSVETQSAPSGAETSGSDGSGSGQ